VTTLAYISLGSNLGDRGSILDRAIIALGEHPCVQVHSVSSYHETKPVGGPAGQGLFLNAAASLATTLDPFGLLRVLQDIESEFGRIRTIRWGERTLDLDLLLYGDRVMESPSLALPHPMLAVRRFVLAPLNEVAAEVTEPITNRSIAWLLDNLDRRPSYLALESWWLEPQRYAGYRRVINSLHAAGFSARERLQPRALIRPEQESIHTELRDSLVSGLQLDRWSRLNDQWLVTDFSPREMLAKALNRTGDAQHRFTQDDSQGQRELGLIQPTLVVIGPSMPEESPCGELRYGGIPTIRPGSRIQVDAIDEILAACAATRI
jgi:2-amino-4-hydroxy-6-hydroxymethyldihydropteridine diphosphokinase